MQNLAEGLGLPSILGGGVNTLTTLQGTSNEEVRARAEAIEANKDALDISKDSLKALTTLNVSLNLAGSRIQSVLIEQLGKVAPVISGFLDSFSHVYRDPKTNKTYELPEQHDIFKGPREWLFGPDKPATLSSPPNNPPL